MALSFGALVVAQKPHLFPTWGWGRSPEGSRASSRPTSPPGERSSRRSRSNSREVAEDGKKTQGELLFIVPGVLRGTGGGAERAAQAKGLSPARAIPRSRLSGTPRRASGCSVALTSPAPGAGGRITANDEAIARRDTAASATPFAMRQCNHCAGLCYNPFDFNGLGVFCSGECAISFDTDRAQEIAALKWEEREEFGQRSRTATLDHDEIDTVDWRTASGGGSELGRSAAQRPPQLERSALKERRPSGGGRRRTSAERDIISAHFG